jgi:hypothetical protein
MESAAQMLSLASKATEFFTGTQAVLVHPMMRGFLFFMVVCFLVLGLMTAYGAARLSFCYTSSLGAPSFGWAILCFFFPHFYYPFYSLFLNPLCPTPSPAPQQQGGAHQKKKRTS